MATPALFLDIDGVLNAFRTPPLPIQASTSPTPTTDTDGPGWRTGTAPCGGRDWQIHWRPVVVDTLRHWHNTGAFELHWLTTWAEEANGGLRHLLGLPELPLLGTGADVNRSIGVTQVEHQYRPLQIAQTRLQNPGRLYRYWWKARLVTDWAQENPTRPFVWVDDDLRRAPTMQRDLKANLKNPCLFISPRSDEGLTDDLIAAIERWRSAP